MKCPRLKAFLSYRIRMFHSGADTGTVQIGIIEAGYDISLEREWNAANDDLFLYRM
ncbi:hypothetical protein [Oceanobacillus saliphilus]|uniref:hypothetical protein n=1 Tax=Oceanobacillus saliphilus TaxID=2925834 RepID=UPI00201E18AF|nr:hypothetical protein [Oceanobacillus saliphilus]